MRQYRKGW